MKNIQLPRAPRSKSWFCATLLLIACTSGTAAAQSDMKGRVLIREDFSTSAVNRKNFPNSSWDIPDTWKLNDGGLECIYDPKQHPGKAHGKSIDPKFKARDVRVSYRVKFGGEAARMVMIINAGFPPVKTGLPVWHIADVTARLPRNPKDACIDIAERDFTRDENDPRNTKKSRGPAEIFKPLGAYEIRGLKCKAHAALEPGKWTTFVVESVGTEWTLWIDGQKTLSQTHKHADCDKESINFIAFGPLVLDDIVIEELPRE
jgi:hypothetical protein